MSEFEIRIDKNQVNNLLRKLDSIASDKVITKGLHDGGNYIEGFIKREKLSGPKPDLLGVGQFPPASFYKGRQPANQIAGLLRSSITTSDVEKDGTNYSVRVGTSVDQVPYARIHEYGGTIYPKKGKFLFFPVQGSVRIMNKSGTKRLKLRGKSGRVLPSYANKYTNWHWVAARSVTIPARSYIRSTAEDLRVIKKVIDIFMDIIKRAIK